MILTDGLVMEIDFHWRLCYANHLWKCFFRKYKLSFKNRKKIIVGKAHWRAFLRKITRYVAGGIRIHDVPSRVAFYTTSLITHLCLLEFGFPHIILNRTNIDCFRP